MTQSSLRPQPIRDVDCSRQGNCTCHDISEARFREACMAGAETVKACFKYIGCMPKCANCVPMIRKVLRDHKA